MSAPTNAPAAECVPPHPSSAAGVTTEEWRPIPDFPEHMVSNMGRVWSRAWEKKGRPPKILATQIAKDGYASLFLWRNGKAHRKRIHTLVMLAFVGPRPEGMEVRHLNGDRTDPRLENLAYGTRSENVQDAIRHGTHPLASRTECMQGHPYTPENTYTNTQGHRTCRVCQRTRSRERYAARKAS